MRLAVSTYLEVEAYLKEHNSLILPIGSTEQHGPTGLLGTDHLTADAVATEVGRKLGLAVAPPICYGMAAHHMDFPGSASLRPSVYQAMLREVIASFYEHGFRRFYLVNGHGGNEFSVRCVFQELKAEGLEGAAFALYNWWKMPAVSKLAQELYGDREGFHATPSEVSLTFHLEKLAPRPYEYRGGMPKAPWPLTAGEMRGVVSDGVMGADPGMARAEHGARFLAVAVDDISAAIASAVYIE